MFGRAVGHNGASHDAPSMLGSECRWLYFELVGDVQRDSGEPASLDHSFGDSAPRLEQEYRFDALRENTAIKPGNGGAPLWNIDNGKGLEIIPERHTELLFNLPPYFVHNYSGPLPIPIGSRNGFGDVTFLGKYRLLSKNGEHGNYILTFFLGAASQPGFTKMEVWRR